MKLGCCYYPEQWDETMWAQDARLMGEVGIDIVRIGEFAWSFMEPSPGDYGWEWLDKAIDILGDAGLKIILGTPTATPPKWLVDLYPEILAFDEQGRGRGFGSRRHYCFSSKVYRREAARIVKQMAQRYGDNPHLIGWQTDNEYGCHDTVRSYSQNAKTAFREWLSDRYETIDALNQAWGTSFWSQLYQNFDEIDLPNLTVTEANPSHQLDFFRFSSDQVVSFNRMQTDILRQASPDKDIYHNFMGHFTQFDHFEVSKDIDVASWDSYPLGFLDQENYRDEDKHRFMRQGHPDFAGFHHDLYRACGTMRGQKNARFAVMEQQPGPVNWAPNNPAPLPGMARLWGHEGRAHGAEMVSYFRWRQAPFAQENLHAGLRRHDNSPAQAFEEVRQLASEIKENPVCPASFQEATKTALVFSYETQWMSQIKPQGRMWDYMQLILDWYGTARSLGLNVDIVPEGGSLDKYDLVLVPSLLHITGQAIKAFESTDAHLVFGPRCGMFTHNMHLPLSLGPDGLQALLPLKVIHSESLPSFHREVGYFEGEEIYGYGWLDHVETRLKPLVSNGAGKGLVFQEENVSLFTTIPDTLFLRKLIDAIAQKIGLETHNLPSGLRVRRGEKTVYGFNYNDGEVSMPSSVVKEGGDYLIGEARLKACGVSLFKK